MHAPHMNLNGLVVALPLSLVLWLGLIMAVSLAVRV